VDVHHVLGTGGAAELPDSLQERQPLNVPDRPAHFDDDHISVGGDPHLADLIGDLIRDMGDDLYRSAQVFSAAFARNDRSVDLPGRSVVVAAEVGVNEPLVVPQVHVRLGAIIGDEHFPVLVRIHRAGIDVDVGVKLQEGHLHPPSHQQAS
jgi:hypothetical protein